jgi:hypothetical protein
MRNKHEEKRGLAPGLQNDLTYNGFSITGTAASQKLNYLCSFLETPLLVYHCTLCTGLLFVLLCCDSDLESFFFFLSFSLYFFFIVLFLGVHFFTVLNLIEGVSTI